MYIRRKYGLRKLRSLIKGRCMDNGSHGITKKEYAGSYTCVSAAERQIQLFRWNSSIGNATLAENSVTYPMVLYQCWQNIFKSFLVASHLRILLIFNRIVSCRLEEESDIVEWRYGGRRYPKRRWRLIASLNLQILPTKEWCEKGSVWRISWANDLRS